MKTAERDIEKINYAFDIEGNNQEVKVEKVLVVKMNGRYIELWHPSIQDIQMIENDEKVQKQVGLYEEALVALKVKSMVPVEFHIAFVNKKE